jgi:type IV fimbrial biogenesis protein FimT
MKTKHTGFTLLELMVTIAIVGIIATIALWNSSTMLQENRAENFLLELKRNISYARSQAASTDEIVIICAVPSYDVTTNKSKLSCQNSWGNGHNIILFVDADNDGSYDVDNDSLLRVMDAFPASDTIKYEGNVNTLRFNTSGRVTTAAGRFFYCPAGNNEHNKALNVSQSGTAFYLGDTDVSCS